MAQEQEKLHPSVTVEHSNKQWARRSYSTCLFSLPHHWGDE